MEGYPPPDEEQAQQESEHRVEAITVRRALFRIIDGVSTDFHDDFTDEYVAYATEIKRDRILHLGLPSEIPDLRVDEKQATILQTSGWAARIHVRLSPNVEVLSSSITKILDRLSGRRPSVNVDDSFLTVEFQVSDGTKATSIWAQEYGFSLAMLFSGIPATYIIQWPRHDTRSKNHFSVVE